MQPFSQLMPIDTINGRYKHLPCRSMADEAEMDQ
jgi:hypothetical protein